MISKCFRLRETEVEMLNEFKGNNSAVVRQMIIDAYRAKFGDQAFLDKDAKQRKITWTKLGM